MQVSLFIHNEMLDCTTILFAALQFCLHEGFKQCLTKACLTQNTVGHTVPIWYTRLYTGWLVRVLSSNRAWGWARTI